MQLIPSPRIPANELRPRRYWYAIAAGIALVLIVLGVAIGVYRFISVRDAVDTDRRFANGETATVRLEPESDRALWVKYPGQSPGPECDITGPGDPVLTDPGTDVWFTRDETWDLLYTIDVSQAGDYTITCSSDALSRYAFGETEGLFAFGIGLVLALLLPVLGVGVCVTVVIVTAVRRRRHRKRLLAERRPAQAG
ncbi:hypothetical protein [Streptomyces sp. RFCAC02]|uniref:hypothetical protein n=1 Tax=Streptomyces sp. RFCAC02 TaxID=2499143 RepID=UPI00102183AD|nr:hypothetical protein [Streptomyces sp. RFCAC02]